MKKNGVINPKLMEAITGLYHYDTIMIADLGFPVPKGVQVIDLSLVKGIPSFQQVMRALFNECVFDEVWIDENMARWNKPLYQFVTESLSEQKINEVGFPELKELASKCKVIVKCGEFKPSANMVLQSFSGGKASVEKFTVSFPPEFE